MMNITHLWEVFVQGISFALFFSLDTLSGIILNSVLKNISERGRSLDYVPSFDSRK